MSMKFNFLKLKRKGRPSLESLRPPIFDTDLFWFASLGLGLVILIITALIGLNLFYSQYFKNYKESTTAENFENLINIDKLKNVVEKRNNFINQEIPLPKDPSL